MNKRRAKDNIPKQAALEGIPEEDLEIMVNAYWKEVLDSLEDVKYIRLTIEGLGTFSTQYGRLNKAIAEKQIYINKNSEKLSSGKGHNMLIRELDKLDHLKKMVKLWDTEYAMRIQLQEKKQEYKRNKQ